MVTIQTSSAGKQPAPTSRRQRAAAAAAGSSRRRTSSGQRDDLSPAEEALVEKYKVIKEKKALQEIARQNSMKQEQQPGGVGRQTADGIDARQAAIDIIRARRRESSGVASGPPKMKIKLSKSSLSKSPVEPQPPPAQSSHESPTKEVKKKKPIVVKRRRGDVQQQQQQPASLHEHEEHGPGEMDLTMATLLISNIPEYCTKDELLSYFGVHCSMNVIDVHIFEGYESAAVTFASAAEARAVLDLQAQQPLELPQWGRILAEPYADQAQEEEEEDYIAPTDPRQLHAMKIDNENDEPDDDRRHVVSYDDL